MKLREIKNKNALVEKIFQTKKKDPIIDYNSILLIENNEKVLGIAFKKERRFQTWFFNPDATRFFFTNYGFAV